jgi:hypothetical protein
MSLVRPMAKTEVSTASAEAPDARKSSCQPVGAGGMAAVVIRVGKALGAVNMRSWGSMQGMLQGPGRLRARPLVVSGRAAYAASFARFRGAVAPPPAPLAVPFAGSWRDPPRPILCVKTARLGGGYYPLASSAPHVAERMIGALPLMPSKNREYLGGYCMLMPSIAGERPKPCRSAGGNPSNRSVRNNGRHSDGNATAPPDSAAVPVVFRDRHVFATCVRLCGCAGRSYPSQSTSHLHEIMGARRTTRTRQVRAVSRWHRSRTGMSLPCGQNIYQPLRSRTVNARPDAHSRLERRAASAGRSVRTAQPTSFVLGVIYTGDACTQPAAAGLRLESRRWWHVCAVPC